MSFRRGFGSQVSDSRDLNEKRQQSRGVGPGRAWAHAALDRPSQWVKEEVSVRSTVELWAR